MKFTDEQIKILHKVVCMPGYSQLTEELSSKEMTELYKLEWEMRKIREAV